MELPTSWILKLTSFIFWSGLYLWCAAKKSDKTPEYWSRQITLLHGSVCTIFGILQCNCSFNKCSFTGHVGPQQYALMLWSWGYFAFDLLWCLMYWTNNAVMLCHHISALGGIDIYMGKRNTGCTYACAIAFMEITNPLLQTRWFLRYSGYGKTLLFYMIEVTYLVSFIGLRGVLGTYLIYRIVVSDVFETDAKLISVIFYFVSMALIYEILGYVFYKYRNEIEEFNGFLDEMGVILNDQT